jgi:hypothetical protein
MMKLRNLLVISPSFLGPRRTGKVSPPTWAVKKVPGPAFSILSKMPMVLYRALARLLKATCVDDFWRVAHHCGTSSSARRLSNSR